MPIIDNDGDVSVIYEIPQNIKDKIPEYFYLAFAGELFSVFGIGTFEKDEDGFRRIDYSTSTIGWVAALKATCQKLDMEWLFTYWEELEWYDSDIFDEKMADEMVSRLEKDSDGVNPYYLHLVKT